MKNQKNKNSFFGLSSAEKVKIVREAADLATKEQITIVNKYGGIKVLKNYSN
jgi:hypothetical protein